MNIPLRFSRYAIRQPALFAERLRKKTDPVSSWLFDTFDERGKRVTDAFQSAWSSHEEFCAIVCENLNRIIATGPIYNESRFMGFELRPNTRSEIKASLSGDDLIRLNRQILEDCFPTELSREYEFDSLKERFDTRVLEWAQSKFREELETDFKRAQIFDSPDSMRRLSILRSRPFSELEILSRILPSKVLYNSADAKLRRDLLDPNENKIVERLRLAIDKDHREKALIITKEYSRMHEKSVKREFNASVRIGNELMKQVAESKQGELSNGARGEWGLLFSTDDFKFVISIKLARYMTLDYVVGLSTHDNARRVRFRDNYLGVLGIGMGDWFVEYADTFTEKLEKAIDCSLWHKQEYQRILEQALINHDL